MAVIINEFEVIPESASSVSQAADSATQQQPAVAQDTLPQDVDSVLRLQYQRAARIRAD